MSYRYHVKAGAPVKVARPGQIPQDHTTQYDQVFEEDELIASRNKVPNDNPAAARWGNRGWYVFFRVGAGWYLIVNRIHVEIEY